MYLEPQFRPVQEKGLSLHPSGFEVRCPVPTTTRDPIRDGEMDAASSG